MTAAPPAPGSAHSAMPAEGGTNSAIAPAKLAVTALHNPPEAGW